MSVSLMHSASCSHFNSHMASVEDTETINNYDVTIAMNKGAYPIVD